MSTQETAKFNVDIIFTNGMKEGELPDDASIEDIIYDAMRQDSWMKDFPIDCIRVEVKSRTGEL